MALGGAITLTARHMSKPQLLSAANLGALFVHQYEEYEDPGWFPGQFNHGVLKSDQPRNYPLNQTTALCVNTVFAYPFYVAPVLFPRQKWLGLAPAFFGIMQSVGHGVIFPRIAGDMYSPRFPGLVFPARSHRGQLHQGAERRPGPDARRHRQGRGVHGCLRRRRGRGTEHRRTR
jgi:hypothetical protein